MNVRGQLKKTECHISRMVFNTLQWTMSPICWAVHLLASRTISEAWQFFLGIQGLNEHISSSGYLFKELFYEAIIGGRGGTKMNALWSTLFGDLWRDWGGKWMPWIRFYEYMSSYRVLRIKEISFCLISSMNLLNQNGLFVSSWAWFLACGTNPCCTPHSATHF